jgi:hypothetical protein
VHQDALFAIVDQWLAGLEPTLFQELLPLLRRTFGAFDAAEKRRIFERAEHPAGAAPSAASGLGPAEAGFDEARAALVLPTLCRLYGLATAGGSEGGEA